MLNSTALERTWWRLVAGDQTRAAQRGKVATCQRNSQPGRLSWNRLSWTPSRHRCLPGSRLTRRARGRGHFRARAEPVAGAERYYSVDVLRGFALLGILAMNIVAFGWPGSAYGNPLRGGGFEGIDRVVWFFNHLVFEMKMMTIFSMLFGAGLVLMDQRAEARGAKIRGVYYRRVLWLLLIGCVHAYLIWSGDILVLYAECGLLLYFFRNLAARTLIILGVSALFFLVPILLGFGAATRLREGLPRAGLRSRPAASQQAGRTAGTARPRGRRYLVGLASRIVPRCTRERRPGGDQKQIKIHRGGYWGIVKDRAWNLFMEHTIGFLLGWLVGGEGRMLIGHGADEAGRLLGNAVAPVLSRDGRNGLWHRLAAHGLRRQRVDPHRFSARATSCTAGCSTITSAAWSWPWATWGC